MNALNHPFSPAPLGSDLFAQFGDNFGLPIVGNFDPPVGTPQVAAPSALAPVLGSETMPAQTVSGESWYSFQPLRSGTISVAATSTAGSTNVHLYDTSYSLLASGSGQAVGQMVASAQVSAGNTYLVRMVGSSSTAGLTITNTVSDSDRVDANRSGSVTASDLLAVINSLLHFGTHATPMDMHDPQLYMDTNLDGRISPSDMLQVINYLLRLPGPGATPATAEPGDAGPAAAPLSPPPAAARRRPRPLRWRSGVSPPRPTRRPQRRPLLPRRPTPRIPHWQSLRTRCGTIRPGRTAWRWQTSPPTTRRTKTGISTTGISSPPAANSRIGAAGRRVHLSGKARRSLPLCGILGPNRLKRPARATIATNVTSPRHAMSHVTRRKALQIGGLGLLGLTLPKLAQAAGRPARARSVIFLYQFGGPSHLDTFDLKPDAPDGIRSPLRSIASTLPGLRVCELLPETAKVMDKVTLVHGMHHTMKNHNSASYYALSGHAPPVDDIRLKDTNDLFPAYGSVADRFLPSAGRSAAVPRFVAFPHVIRDGSITPGQRASFLGQRHDPMLLTEDPAAKNFRLPELSLPDGVSLDRLTSRRAMQQLVNHQRQWLDQSAEARGLDAYYERALAMLTSPDVREAFDLAAEPQRVRERYGRTTYGQSCLLARRLVEAGVSFVNVYFSSSIGGRSKTSGGWDTHGFDGSRMYEILPVWQLPQTDRALPALLADLDERGLLDETLVVWMGEFGRTPRINKNSSRDHWPHCYTVLLAGGGVKRGFRYGASDKNGAYPAADPVRPDDLAATVFALLGIDPQTEMHDALGRPFPISRGRPLTGLMA